MLFANIAPVVRARMARVCKTDTKPEQAVRQIAYRLGYRYRLHRRNLPGTPDLVFSALKKVVAVHGCFWRLAPVEKFENRPVGPTISS
jgi:DNA mismatch endonuclease (patch repair protein)